MVACKPLVPILTGNSWIGPYCNRTILLVWKVSGEIIHMNLENVLYVFTLQTIVNLFSIVVLAETGYWSNFGFKGIEF